MEAQKELRRAQKNEITEHSIYKKLAGMVAHSPNRKVLLGLAREEMKHYNVIKSLTKRDAEANRIKVFWYVLLARVFGAVFSLRLMERGEQETQQLYKLIDTPKIRALSKDEKKHEEALIRLLKDEKLTYASSIVLGLNDALVELTGALAGLTLALQNSSMIALIGFITGFAASLSMAASSFLSTSEEEGIVPDKSPAKGALYTGIAYIIVVTLLVLPYILFSNRILALAGTLAIAMLIILAYSSYMAVLKETRFLPRFLRMAAISLSVAFVSFLAGWLLRVTFGIEA